MINNYTLYIAALLISLLPSASAQHDLLLTQNNPSEEFSVAQESKGASRLLTYTIPHNVYIKGNLRVDKTVTYPGIPSTFSASYGKMSLSSGSINFHDSSVWYPVPFNTIDLSSRMTLSITEPARITIRQSGVYQINFNLHFSVDTSDEGSFITTTYRLGVKINGGPTLPVAAIHIREPGACSLTYSDIRAFSANDYLCFYLDASTATEPPFANQFTLENGNAFLVQISS